MCETLFGVGGSWGENILGGWRWVRKYFGWVGVKGGEWDIILGGWGWVEKYFGYVGVDKSE